MAKMSQIQVRYIEEEDRLLLRMNTMAEEEFRFWLTRRFTKAIWPLFQRALHETPTVKKQSLAPNKSVVLNFEHEEAQKSVDFKKSFKKEAKDFPLGEKPLLLNQASLKGKGNGSHTLSLKAVDNKGIEFVLDQRLMHVITKVIRDSMKNTDWALDLPLTQVPTATAAPPQTKHLH